MRIVSGEMNDSAIGMPAGLSAICSANFIVVGPDIARVDALATLGFLEGRAGLERLDATPGYGALAMLRDRTLLATEGFRNITI